MHAHNCSGSRNYCQMNKLFVAVVHYFFYNNKDKVLPLSGNVILTFLIFLIFSRFYGNLAVLNEIAKYWEIYSHNSYITAGADNTLVLIACMPVKRCNNLFLCVSGS